MVERYDRLNSRESAKRDGERRAADTRNRASSAFVHHRTLAPFLVIFHRNEGFTLRLARFMTLPEQGSPRLSEHHSDLFRVDIPHCVSHFRPAYVADTTIGSLRRHSSAVVIASISAVVFSSMLALPLVHRCVW